MKKLNLIIEWQVIKCWFYEPKKLFPHISQSAWLYICSLFFLISCSFTTAPWSHLFLYSSLAVRFLCLSKKATKQLRSTTSSNLNLLQESLIWSRLVLFVELSYFLTETAMQKDIPLTIPRWWNLPKSQTVILALRVTRKLHQKLGARGLFRSSRERKTKLLAPRVGSPLRNCELFGVH